MAREKARTTAWILITVLTALFMVGLVLVSFWGGPFEADSYWLKEASPTFPG